MLIAAQRGLTRRALLKWVVFSGAALAADSSGIASSFAPLSRVDPFAGGKKLGTIPFINEGSVPTDTPVGSELDGRLYTDLSTLDTQNLTTPTEKFYIRTRASRLLPEPASWRLKVDGRAGRLFTLDIGTLQNGAKPMGVHVMECAGNVPLTDFGLLSAARWTGVPVSELIERAQPNPGATHVLITGFDRYAAPSATSIPGASWVFSREELEKTRAFLATEMSGQPLSKDHGAPVRLVVPGWYGCACIKWVETITLVGENIGATSQMREYAVRTHQQGIPRLVTEYEPPVIDQAAMPIRVEKWSVAGKIKYRVVGIAWGGSTRAPSSPGSGAGDPGRPRPGPPGSRTASVGTRPPAG